MTKLFDKWVNTYLEPSRLILVNYEVFTRFYNDYTKEMSFSDQCQDPKVWFLLGILAWSRCSYIRLPKWKIIIISSSCVFNSCPPGSHTSFCNLSLVVIVVVCCYFPSLHTLCCIFPLTMLSHSSVGFLLLLLFFFLIFVFLWDTFTINLLIILISMSSLFLTGTHSVNCLQTIVFYLLFEVVGFLLPPLHPYPLVALEFLSHFKTTYVQYLW